MVTCSIHGIALARDDTGEYVDRTGLVDVQYSTSARPTESTKDWKDLGTAKVNPRRVLYKFKRPVEATGLRLVLHNSDICIDELEVLGVPISAPSSWQTFENLNQLQSAVLTDEKRISLYLWNDFLFVECQEKFIALIPHVPEVRPHPMHIKTPHVVPKKLGHFPTSMNIKILCLHLLL